MEPSIEYDVTLDDLALYGQVHASRSPTARRARIWWLFLLGGPLYLLAMLSLLRGGTAVGLVLLAGTTLFVLWYLLSLPRMAGATTRRLYAEQDGKGTLGRHTLRATAEGIEESTEYGQNRTTWPAVQGIVETPDLALIYIGPLLAHVIPRRRIVKGDYEAFMREARRLYDESRS